MIHLLSAVAPEGASVNLAEALTVAQVMAYMGVLAGVVATVRKVWPIIARAKNFMDDVSGEPARAGVAARPGVLERLSSHEALLAEMHHELRPNGGGSIKDAVNRIEVTTKELVERTEVIEKNQTALTRLEERQNNMDIVLTAHLVEAIKLSDHFESDINSLETKLEGQWNDQA